MFYIIHHPSVQERPAALWLPMTVTPSNTSWPSQSEKKKKRKEKKAERQEVTTTTKCDIKKGEKKQQCSFCLQSEPKEDKKKSARLHVSTSKGHLKVTPSVN